MENGNGHSVDGNEYWGICYFYTDEIGMITGFPSDVYYINYIIGLIFNILLTILTIFLNSVTILAYLRSAQLKNKKSYFLIMLLSVNDLLLGLFGNSSYVLVLFTIIIGYPRCKTEIAFEFVAFCLGSMSVMTLFALNIERYLSILHPFYHRTKVTRSRLLKILVPFWLLGFTFRSFYFVFGKYMNIMSSVVLAFIALSTLYIYISIYVAIRRRPQLTETGERATETRVAEGRTNQTKGLQNIKMTKSCAIVVGLVFACNLPIAFNHSQPRNNILVALWCTIFSFSVSSLNSLVFFWKNAILRKESKKLFHNQS